MNQPYLMIAERGAQVLAATSAALVKPYDVVGITTRLLTAAADVIGASAGGIILREPDRTGFDVLATTSHRAEDLEAYQVQQQQGPCFEAADTGRSVTADSAEIERRWPVVAAQFARSGYRQVLATPLLWQGTAIGALNLFWESDGALEAETRSLIQAFTDMATLAIVHAGAVSTATVLARTRAALDERTVLEQAKGVLVYQLGVTMEEAFAELLRRADANGELVSTTAAVIVARATSAG